jgi:hypothetical protein
MSFSYMTIMKQKSKFVIIFFNLFYKKMAQLLIHL